MLVSERRHSIETFIGAMTLMGTLIFVSTTIGCESTPIRAIRGARHYSAGTEALTQSDPDRAIAELERAADLVPHASEIQNHLGLAYWSGGRTQAARVAFETAIELDCENKSAQANLEYLIRSDGLAVEAFPDVGKQGE